jgi:phosphoglycolate phosphatase
MLKGVVFDLDGTLLNTLEDLTDSVNKFLSNHNFPIHTCDDVRQMVGNGASMLILRALPHNNFSDEEIKIFYDEYREIYKDNQKHTKLYDGISQVLDYLEEKCIKIAIVTNKHDDAAKFCRELYLKKWKIEQSIGQKEGIPVKPDPFMLNEVIKIWGFNKDEIIFVGDSPEDMQTAINAGVAGIGAGWGFRNCEVLNETGAAFSAENPKELFDYIRQY